MPVRHGGQPPCRKPGLPRSAASLPRSVLAHSVRVPFHGASAIRAQVSFGIIRGRGVGRQGALSVIQRTEGQRCGLRGSRGSVCSVALPVSHLLRRTEAKNPALRVCGRAREEVVASVGRVQAKPIGLVARASGELLRTDDVFEADRLRDLLLVLRPRVEENLGFIVDREIPLCRTGKPFCARSVVLQLRQPAAVAPGAAGAGVAHEFSLHDAAGRALPKA
mmetsp:Transcript_3615/g.8515  ORF Transcript_3615/g.8515 Transcript_3615/m.8515 type:complete len:221 (-) Transcript_3615:20-682(-)